MPRKRKKQLVSQMLENIGADALERYQHIIRRYTHHRQGVYALYRNEKLYYVGLAQNLQRRLHNHLRDRHRGLWNKFSVYLTIGDGFVKEMESLLLRITRPKGNKVLGKFVNCQDLHRTFRRDYNADTRAELQRLLGRRRPTAISAVKSADRHSPELARYIKKGMPLVASRRKGQNYKARVLKNGSIRFKGATFATPSGAAKAACGGKRVDGWTFWRFPQAPGDWVLLKEIRRYR